MQRSSTFQDANLDHTDFSKKCLIGYVFQNCSLRFCTFADADLSYARFIDCDLYNATFERSVLYACRFTSCDCTKVDLSSAKMSGVRITDSDVTHAAFGKAFEVGCNRKPVRPEECKQNYLTVRPGEEIPAVADVEARFGGIRVTGTSFCIAFDNDADQPWRVWRRKSEIAKIIRRILVENGYSDMSLDYYYEFRRFHRLSNPNIVAQYVDYIFGDLLWGYGVKWQRPVATYFAAILFFSCLYTLIPLLDDTSGLAQDGSVIVVFGQPCVDGFSNFLHILYFCVLTSSLSTFGNIDAVGIGRFVAVLQVLVGIVVIGLVVAAVSRRLANA